MYIIYRNDCFWWFPKLKKWAKNINELQQYSYSNNAKFHSKKKAFKEFLKCPIDSTITVITFKRHKKYIMEYTRT
jgi:hypothetical protein